MTPEEIRDELMQIRQALSSSSQNLTRIYQALEAAGIAKPNQPKCRGRQRKVDYSAVLSYSRSKMSQRKIAEKLGITSGAVNKILKKAMAEQGIFPVAEYIKDKDEDTIYRLMSDGSWMKKEPNSTGWYPSKFGTDAEAKLLDYGYRRVDSTSPPENS